MRATFKVLFYVNRSKEKNGAHHGPSDNQRHDSPVQLQAQYPKGTLGYQRELSSYVILNSKTVRCLPRLVPMRLERFSLPKSL